MRTLRLARIAAEAEGLRLRQLARRKAVQGAMVAVAVVFVICALAVAHFCGWLALVKVVAPLSAALIVLGVDLVLALIFGLLGMRSSPNRVERDAILVREQAKQQLAIATATATTWAPIARMVGLRHLSGVLIGALATRYLARQQ